MAAKKGKKENKTPKAAYVRVATLNDLARSVMGEKSYIMALKQAGKYRLMGGAERVGEGHIIFYFEVNSLARYLIYSADEEHGERAELVNDVTERNDHFKSQRIPIIEISTDPYSPLEKADAKGMLLIKVSDKDALIRALVNEIGEDSVPKLYSFASGKEAIIGSFALMKHDSFLYSKAAQKGLVSNISYDSSSDTIEASNSLSGPSKLRIPVINLAEPLPFLKE